MAETTVQINLDEHSIQILKGVNKIHRDSIINVGLALVEKTMFYKTLKGTNKSEEIQDVASLENEEVPEVKTKKQSTNTPVISEKPKATSWDNF